MTFRNNPKDHPVPKMHLSASFEVPDDHRAQSKITAAIDPDIAKLEAAIEAETGKKVTVVSRIVRDKAVSVKDTAVAPVVMETVSREAAE